MPGTRQGSRRGRRRSPRPSTRPGRPFRTIATGRDPSPPHTTTLVCFNVNERVYPFSSTLRSRLHRTRPTETGKSPQTPPNHDLARVVYAPSSKRYSSSCVTTATLRLFPSSEYLCFLVTWSGNPKLCGKECKFATSRGVKYLRTSLSRISSSVFSRFSLSSGETLDRWMCTRPRSSTNPRLPAPPSSGTAFAAISDPVPFRYLE
mmetsp:Transcript_8456/g.30525  ORF Transcript_8456/g.30525 Transcript_8456/m.30525 type:complete len:205 (-) Transcript_8456:686-1300(-)